MKGAKNMKKEGTETVTVKTIPMNKFGKDHWSTFAYIETRGVDYAGQPARNHMGCNDKRHPGLGKSRNCGWKDEYSTRLRGHTTSKPNRVIGHDDWDCAYDLEEAGLLKDNGTGINPVFELTVLGFKVASLLRQHKAGGGVFATFAFEDGKQVTK